MAHKLFTNETPTRLSVDDIERICEDMTQDVNGIIAKDELIEFAKKGSIFTFADPVDFIRPTFRKRINAGKCKFSTKFPNYHLFLTTFKTAGMKEENVQQLKNCTSDKNWKENDMLLLIRVFQATNLKKNIHKLCKFKIELLSTYQIFDKLKELNQEGLINLIKLVEKECELINENLQNEEMDLSNERVQGVLNQYATKEQRELFKGIKAEKLNKALQTTVKVIELLKYRSVTSYGESVRGLILLVMCFHCMPLVYQCNIFTPIVTPSLSMFVLFCQLLRYSFHTYKASISKCLVSLKFNFVFSFNLKFYIKKMTQACRGCSNLLRCETSRACSIFRPVEFGLILSFLNPYVFINACVLSEMELMEEIKERIPSFKFLQLRLFKVILSRAVDHSSVELDDEDKMFLKRKSEYETKKNEVGKKYLSSYNAFPNHIKKLFENEKLSTDFYLTLTSIKNSSLIDHEVVLKKTILPYTLHYCLFQNLLVENSLEEIIIKKDLYLGKNLFI